MRSKGFSILTISMVLMVCTTCTKDEALLTPEGESSALKSTSVEHAVFEVFPNGEDDTENIIVAFENAKAEGSGSVVYLTEGVYYTSKPIVIANFNGTFMGAGKDKTIVQNIDNDAFPLISDDFPLGIGGGLLPELFCFYSDGDNMTTTLSISDLTLKFKGKAVVHNEFWWGSEGRDTDRLDNFIVILGNVNGESDLSSINATIKNVNIEGERGPEFMLGINNQFGIVLFGEAIFNSDGQYTDDDRIIVNSVIEGCNFSSNQFGIGVYYPVDSKILVQNNHFENIWRNGIRSIHPKNSQIEIYKNLFDVNGYAGIYLSTYDGALDGPNQTLIHHNDFIISGYWWGTGIYLGDWEYIEGDLVTVIKSNNFILDTYWGDGMVSNFSRDILVSNNKFTGTAWSGIYASNSDGLVILGDNINNLVPTGIDYIYARDEDGYIIYDENDNPIILEEYGPYAVWLWNSSNCTVVGNAKTNILDLGDNNILTGVTRHTGPPGPEISAALEEKLKKFHPSFSRGR